MYFGLLLATGVFFVFIAFTMFLPIMVLMPQKFAICFTLGCGFIIGSFFALRGPTNQLAHMSTKEVYLLYLDIPMVYFCNMIFDGLTDYQLNIHLLVTLFWWFVFLLFIQRLPLTLGFIGSMVATIYVSMVLHSYLLSVLFSVIQVSNFMSPLYFFTLYSFYPMSLVLFTRSNFLREHNLMYFLQIKKV